MGEDAAPLTTICPRCNGQGRFEAGPQTHGGSDRAAYRYHPDLCQVCKGTGQVEIGITCQDCKGRGVIDDWEYQYNCGTCHGTGQIHEPRDHGTIKDEDKADSTFKKQVEPWLASGNISATEIDRSHRAMKKLLSDALKDVMGRLRPDERRPKRLRNYPGSTVATALSSQIGPTWKQMDFEKTVNINGQQCLVKHIADDVPPNRVMIDGEWYFSDHFLR